MAVPVDLSPHAALDLEEIAAYIARDDEVAAERWVERLATRALRLGTHPRSGRVVPEYREPNIREVIVGNYRIIYKIEPARVPVLKFVEGHKRVFRR